MYQQAYRLAREIFVETKHFPLEERYSLTDQIRRSSRSVVANLAEGFRKRRYAGAFVHKLIEADSEIAETQVWLDFARDFEYVSESRYAELTRGYEEVGRMLGAIILRPGKFVRQ